MLAPATLRQITPDANIPSARTRPLLRDVNRVQAPCSSCHLKALCLPCGLRADELDTVDQLVHTRRRVLRGEALYRAGDPFKSLYAARIGFFKSVVVMADGRNQITGFVMSGEMLGMDGIESGIHTVSVVALEDSEVCVIPYAQLEAHATRLPRLQHQIYKIMSREIVREQGIMMLLGSTCAEERVAAFLVNLSQRFEARGYSSAEFNLRMTREEIGSYLGLKLETVSRIMSKFQDLGLIQARLRSVRILDAAGLKQMMVKEERRVAAG